MGENRKVLMERNKNNMPKMDIFIDSFDGNSDVWGNFFTVFDIFWPNCKYDTYLVSNELDFHRKNLTVIKTGPDRTWINCTLKAIESLDCKYFMFLLDDYYFSKKMKNGDVDEIIRVMEKKNVYFYRLSLRKDLDKSNSYQHIYSDFYNAVNLQPAIWRRDKFIELLRKVKSLGLNSPWDFERYCIERLKRNDLPTHVIEGVLYDTRDIMGYHNSIIQGKWVRHIFYYYKYTLKVNLSKGDRKFMSLSDEFLDFAKRKGHAVFSYSTREKLKKVLSKLGFHFMSK